MNNSRDYTELRSRIDRGESPKGEIWSRVEQAASQGDAEAAFTLGYRYLQLHGPNHPKVRGWLAKAAHSGHARAQKHLSEVDELRRAQRRCLLAAAQSGDALAQREYACIVCTDWDQLGKDIPAGRFWYGQAAEQGLESAQYEYGLMLLNGEGGPIDLKEGALWLHRSAEAGYEDAARLLGQAYEVGALGLTSDSERAHYWSAQVDR